VPLSSSLVERPIPVASGAVLTRTRPWLGVFLAGIAALAVLTLGGCLQDAYNADKDFNFDNPIDPTPTNASGVVIAHIDTAAGVATIINSSGISQDLTGWTLVNTTGPVSFPFPSSFILATGAFVRVHASTTGSDSTIDLYSGPAWAPLDTADLNNASPALVSQCTAGNPCWD
jgi:Lamin Tail Domain